MSDFQQTVDLRGQAEKQRLPAAWASRSAPVKKITAPLEKIYQPAEAKEPEKDLRKISQPKTGGPSAGLFRQLVFVIAILAAVIAVYFLFFRTKENGPAPLASGWYAVKLVDGEIFYGQISDVRADPVVIANVYYNYDQTKPNAEAKDSGQAAEAAGLAALSGNLRLVKRGKETHGPDGSLNVVRAQILYMEPLKSDSKVLRAMLEYEK